MSQDSPSTKKPPVDAARIKEIPALNVSAYWPMILSAMAEAWPDVTQPERQAELMQMALSGTLRPWAIFGRVDGEMKLAGMACTQIVDEPHGRVMALITVTAHSRMPLSCWKQLQAAIEAAARHNGCVAIRAMTTQPGVVRLAEALGYGAVKWVLEKRVQ